MQKAFKLELNIDPDTGQMEWCEIETFIIEDNEGDILNISKDEYTPTKGDKFYFLPGVSIPRVKLKDLTRDYGVKSTRNINDATHIFAGRSTQHKVSDSSWVYRIPTEEIQSFYDHYKEREGEDDYYVEKIGTALQNNEYKNVFMGYNTASIFRNGKSEIFETIRENIKENGKGGLRQSSYVYTVQEDFVEDILEIEKLELPILDESSLLKHINGEDATTIDEEVHKQLSDMFLSTDTDNHVLAMEIMANSNYLDSLLYLELLFKEHSYRMERCRSKNHVNFKGLLAFIGKEKSNMSTTIDDIVKSLRINESLTIEKLDYILNKYSDEITHHGDTDIFQVKTITVNEDLLKELNHNYVYKKVGDLVTDEDVFRMCDEIIELQTESETASSEVTTDTVEEVEEVEVNNEPEITLEEQKEENNGEGFDWF